MTITTDYKKNRKRMKDFHHVVALAMRRRRVLGARIFYGVFGVLGLGSGVILLWAAGDVGKSALPTGALGLIVGAYFMVRAVFYYPVLGLFSARTLTQGVDTVTYTFTDAGVTVDDALEHCEHPYHIFRGVYEARRVFVLMVTQRIGYLIAKDDLSPEEENAVRELLQTRFEVPLRYFNV